jgi:DnaK suppressor protein
VKQPRKPQAGAAEKKKLRGLLEARLRQLTAEMQGMMRDVRAAGRAHERAADEQDVSESYQRSDVDLTVVQMKAETVARIQAALRRIDAGTYGRCVGCEAPIAFERLRALPFALRCTACEESRERVTRVRRERPASAWKETPTGFQD